MKILYVLRTIAMYAYMFGYMLLFYPVLRQGEKAQAAGDREGAVTASHSLKGVCGNLSMTELFDLLTRQVGLLRAEDWAGAMALMPGVDRAYEETCRAIREAFG